MYQPPREVEAIRQIYAKKVKPSIEQGEYELALLQLGNATILAETKKRTIMEQTNSGIPFIISLRTLGERLEGGDTERIKSAQRIFEMYSAQTSVPGEEFA